MPKYRFELQSQRGKPIDDRVLVYILETERSGLVRDRRNLKHDDESFTVDVVPGKYQLSLEVSDFDNFFTKELVLPKTDDDSKTIRVELEHKCRVLRPMVNWTRSNSGSSKATVPMVRMPGSHLMTIAAPPFPRSVMRSARRDSRARGSVPP